MLHDCCELTSASAAGSRLKEQPHVHAAAEVKEERRGAHALAFTVSALPEASRGHAERFQRMGTRNPPKEENQREGHEMRVDVAHCSWLLRLPSSCHTVSHP